MANRYAELLSLVPRGRFYDADGEILPHREASYEFQFVLPEALTTTQDSGIGTAARGPGNNQVTLTADTFDASKVASGDWFQVGTLTPNGTFTLGAITAQLYSFDSTTQITLFEDVANFVASSWRITRPRTFGIFVNEVFRGEVSSDAAGIARFALHLDLGRNDIRLQDTVTGTSLRHWATVRTSAVYHAAYAEVIEGVPPEGQPALATGDTALVELARAPYLIASDSTQLEQVGPNYIEEVHGRPLRQPNDLSYLIEPYRLLLEELRQGYRLFGGMAHGLSNAVVALTDAAPFVLPRHWRPQWLLGGQLLPNGDLATRARDSTALRLAAGIDFPDINARSLSAVVAAFVESSANIYAGVIVQPPHPQQLTVTFPTGWQGGDITIDGLDVHGVALSDTIVFSAPGTEVTPHIFVSGTQVTKTLVAGTTDEATIGLAEDRFVKLVSIGSRFPPGASVLNYLPGLNMLYTVISAEPTFVTGVPVVPSFIDTGGLDYAGSLAQPNLPQRLAVTFPAYWGGGDIVLAGTDDFEADITERVLAPSNITTSPTPVEVSTERTFSAVTDVSKTLIGGLGSALVIEGRRHRHTVLDTNRRGILFGLLDQPYDLEEGVLGRSVYDRFYVRLNNGPITKVILTTGLPGPVFAADVAADINAVFPGMASAELDAGTLGTTVLRLQTSTSGDTALLELLPGPGDASLIVLGIPRTQALLSAPVAAAATVVLVVDASRFPPNASAPYDIRVGRGKRAAGAGWSIGILSGATALIGATGSVRQPSDLGGAVRIFGSGSGNNGVHPIISVTEGTSSQFRCIHENAGTGGTFTVEALGGAAWLLYSPGEVVRGFSRTAFGIDIGLTGTGDSITAPAPATGRQTLTDAAAVFPPWVVGLKVTITLANVLNNGVFTILARTPTSVTYSNPTGIAETSGLTWRVGGAADAWPTGGLVELVGETPIVARGTHGLGELVVDVDRNYALVGPLVTDPLTVVGTGLPDGWRAYVITDSSVTDGSTVARNAVVLDQLDITGGAFAPVAVGDFVRVTSGPFAGLIRRVLTPGPLTLGVDGGNLPPITGASWELLRDTSTLTSTPGYTKPDRLEVIGVELGELCLEHEVPRAPDYPGLVLRIAAQVQQHIAPSTAGFHIDVDFGTGWSYGPATTVFGTMRTATEGSLDPVPIVREVEVPFDAMRCLIRVRHDYTPMTIGDAISVESVAVLAVTSTGLALGSNTIARSDHRDAFGELLYVWSPIPMSQAERWALGLPDPTTSSSLPEPGHAGHIDTITNAHGYWERLDVSEYQGNLPANTVGLHTDVDWLTATLTNLELLPSTPPKTTHARPPRVSATIETLAIVAPSDATLANTSDQDGEVIPNGRSRLTEILGLPRRVSPRVYGVGTAISAPVVGVQTLTASGPVFTQAMIGRDLIIIGSTVPANNGVFTVLDVPTPFTIRYTNPGGAADLTYAGAWAVDSPNTEAELLVTGTRIPVPEEGPTIDDSSRDVVPSTAERGPALNQVTLTGGTFDDVAVGDVFVVMDGEFVGTRARVTVVMPATLDLDRNLPEFTGALWRVYRMAWYFTADNAIHIDGTMFDSSSSYELEYQVLMRAETAVIDLAFNLPSYSAPFATYLDYLWLVDLGIFTRYEQELITARATQELVFTADFTAQLDRRTDRDKTSATVFSDNGRQRLPVRDSDWAFVDSQTVRLNSAAFSADQLYVIEYNALAAQPHSPASFVVEWRGGISPGAVTTAAYRTVEVGDVVDRTLQYHQLRITLHDVLDVRDFRIQALGLRGIRLYGTTPHAPGILV